MGRTARSFGRFAACFERMRSARAATLSVSLPTTTVCARDRIEENVRPPEMRSKWISTGTARSPSIHSTLLSSETRTGGPPPISSANRASLRRFTLVSRMRRSMSWVVTGAPFSMLAELPITTASSFATRSARASATRVFSERSEDVTTIPPTPDEDRTADRRQQQAPHEQPQVCLGQVRRVRGARRAQREHVRHAVAEEHQRPLALVLAQAPVVREAVLYEVDAFVLPGLLHPALHLLAVLRADPQRLHPAALAADHRDGPEQHQDAQQSAEDRHAVPWKAALGGPGEHDAVGPLRVVAEGGNLASGDALEHPLEARLPLVRRPLRVGPGNVDAVVVDESQPQLLRLQHLARKTLDMAFDPALPERPLGQEFPGAESRSDGESGAEARDEDGERDFLPAARCEGARVETQGSGREQGHSPTVARRRSPWRP